MAEKIKKEEVKKIEREYIIPLRKKFQHVPKYKRANKAVKIIREFLVRHMKIYDRNLNRVKLDKYLNEYLWFRGIKNPPEKIKVKAIREGDIVRVELVEMSEKLKFKKLREEKRDKKAEETLSKKPKKVEEKLETAEDEEKKKETEEKKAAVVEEGKKAAEQAAKSSKHVSKVEKPQIQRRKQLSR